MESIETRLSWETNVSNFEHLISRNRQQQKDVRALPPGSFTDVNLGCLSRSWLDHVALSPCLLAATEAFAVFYSSVSCDHFPLTVTLNTWGLPTPPQVNHSLVSEIKWNFEGSNKREEHGRVVTELLRERSTDPARLFCFSNVCSSPAHRSDTDRLHSGVCDAVRRAGERVF